MATTGGAAVTGDEGALWASFVRAGWASDDLELAVDASRAGLDGDYLERASGAVAAAVGAMAELEAGATANVTEGKMVGHYWLRAPELAPSTAIRDDIRGALARVHAFVRGVRSGAVGGTDGPFERVVHVGVGGSALGPQLVCRALARPGDAMRVDFLDNNDPDAVDDLLARVGPRLGRTLVSVVSKSGVTPTPDHLRAELAAAYERAGLPFRRHAVATTMPGTPLDERARGEGWLDRFPLWDWVGGRTSVTSVVGLLPAALQGCEVEAFLDGAAAMDAETRNADVRANPAALLALAWYRLGEGSGRKRMVVLPYKDRLSLLPRYVQQLVMESIGKHTDRRGRVVEQGLTVYGNKGSTDQHAYVQQLRDGPADFFALLVGVDRERDEPLVEIEPGLTLGDFLAGALEGLREALDERGRRSILLTVRDVSARSLGALVALFERAVGIYAELIDVNAYDQPGVDKFAAVSTVRLQRDVIAALSSLKSPATAESVAHAIGQRERADVVYRLLLRLSRDPRRGIRALPGEGPWAKRFQAVA